MQRIGGVFETNAENRALFFAPLFVRRAATARRPVHGWNRRQRPDRRAVTTGPQPKMSLRTVLPSSTVRLEALMTVKTSISLTDDQEAYARALVESGQYPSLSAVLQRGLEMLRHDNELRDVEIQGLRSLIDQRRAGAFVDLDEGEAETRAMLERKRKARAAL
jgi:antitoxin ParD1/3/4